MGVGELSVLGARLLQDCVRAVPEGGKGGCLLALGCLGPGSWLLALGSCRAGVMRVNGALGGGGLGAFQGSIPASSE